MVMPPRGGIWRLLRWSSPASILGWSPILLWVFYLADTTGGMPSGECEPGPSALCHPALPGWYYQLPTVCPYSSIACLFWVSHWKAEEGGVVLGVDLPSTVIHAFRQKGSRLLPAALRYITPTPEPTNY